jgi:hypothetical protein
VSSPIWISLNSSWISPLLKKSHQQGALNLVDLYDLPTMLQSTILTDQLEANWFDEIRQYPDNPSLIRATLRTLGWKPFVLGLLEIINVSDILSNLTYSVNKVHTFESQTVRLRISIRAIVSMFCKRS